MAKNYNDFVEAMHRAYKDGEQIEHLVLSDESFGEFMTDEKMSEEQIEMQENLGEFGVPVEEGDGDYILTTTGRRYKL